MKNYLGLIILGFLGIVVIFSYYIGYPFHGEQKDVYYYVYLLLVGVLYVGYKIAQSLYQEHTIVIRPSHVLYAFLIQYLGVCIYFFVVTGASLGGGVLLFFKSLLFVFASAFIWLSMYCFGKKILSMHESTNIEDSNVASLVSLGVGCIATLFFVFLSASFGAYNILSIIIIFGIIIGISYSQWRDTLRSFLYSRKTYTRKNDELGGNMSLIIDELLVICVTFLLSVNFLSVFRPFPIGWDDLGVYMNYPKLLSGAGEHLALGKMYFWELYTGIGFLAGSQTFSFYLNSFSGVIALFVIYFTIRIFTKNIQEKYDFALLAALSFLMMPMVIFQIAKDMKIDIGLFSISVIALGLLYYVLWNKKNSTNYALYGVLGILIGAAFAIKVTSLLLLLGILAALFYERLKTLGFIVFLLVFIGIFSIAQLWGIINVVVPGNGAILQQFGWMSFILGVLGFVYMSVPKFRPKNSIDIKVFISQIVCVLLGFCLVLSPWFIKHYGEVPAEYDAGLFTLVGGVSDSYKIDYLSIYTPEELQEIESGVQSGISESGTTSNEDWGRYFGYEGGINNFLKLPWNLTFQTNQKGEFTDITFIFLALIPGIFLFLPYRRQAYKYPVIGFIFLGLAYYIPSPLGGLITQLFAQIHLPGGYGVIIGLFLLPILYFSWALDRSEKVVNYFLVNLAFLTVYMGLWGVSSYGVVWYGVVQYFVLLLLVLLCICLTYKDSTIHTYSSYMVLAFVCIYLFQSSLPHGISNIKSAAYGEYKVGIFNEEVSLMSYHPEYFPIMYELNISDEAKQDLFIEYRKRILTAMSPADDFSQILPQIQAFTSMNELHRLILELSRISFPQESINIQIQNIRQDLYQLIIYTPKDYKNTKNIFRAGTFLKYFISENNTRIFEDSLLTSFDTYIHDDERSITIERLKKLNLDYILLDLNAATIDNDPEKNLTQRHENILDLFVDPNLELIETDSICLRVGLDNYALQQNIETYQLLSSVNHSSEFTQSQKRATCFGVIQEIISNDTILTQYPYLTPYKNAIEQANIDVTDTEIVIGALGQLIRGNGFKALFKIK